MLDVFNTSPPNTNYQEFYGGGTTRDWVKPRGVSMVRIMLIGGGGAGGRGSSSAGGGGGGSGAITSWIGPAMFIPDTLRIFVGAGAQANVPGITTASIVSYQAKDGVGYELLRASGGGSGNDTGNSFGSGGVAMNNNYFGASGIFTSVAGQEGSSGGTTGAGENRSASTDTFLSGGAGGSGNNTNTGGSVTPNYGYTPLPTTTAGGTVPGANGYFITQPILVGCGGAGGTTSTAIGSAGGHGGIGCGGGGAGEDAAVGSGGRGGDGAVFIWAW